MSRRTQPLFGPMRGTGRGQKTRRRRDARLPTLEWSVVAAMTMRARLRDREGQSATFGWLAVVSSQDLRGRALLWCISGS